MDEVVGPATVSVVGVRVLARYILELTFDTAEVRVLDFERLMWDSSFKPLLADYRLFCEVEADPGTGTITWPNVGADWSSEELYTQSKPAVPRASRREATQEGRPRVVDEDAARAVAARSVEEDAVAGSVVIKRYRRIGNRAVVAVEFISARTGRPRRGFAGVVLRDGRWRPSGGWSSDVVQQEAVDEIWRNSGGWSNGGWTVHGGWVAGLSAVQFRAVDRAGRAEHDTLRDGIAILIWEGDLDADTRGELLDADGGVLRSGLVLRPRPLVR